MSSLIERCAKLIRGTLSCIDRLVISGTLPSVCYDEGMAQFVIERGIRLYDYPSHFAQPMREEIHRNAERLARESGVEIQCVRSVRDLRKEDRVQQVLAKRGSHPGLVHILSAMEQCTCFKPYTNKQTGHTTLKATSGKCAHFYFYFIDEELGLCYLRVPTWAPFRLQFYCNGHNRVAERLRRDGVDFVQSDNAFLSCADFSRAQQLADGFPVNSLHRKLDGWARLYCPPIRNFPYQYHWSLMQVEYATDIIFRRPEDLKHLYRALVETAIHAVKADNVATFLGRKLHPNYQGEVGNRFHTRIQGTCIKHHMGWAAIKLYDKFCLILRIETTVNDVTFFSHHRKVEHRDGTSEIMLAPMQKTIYSLPALVEMLAAANRRYIDYLSSIADPTIGHKKLDKITQPARANHRAYRGFNLFNQDDVELFRALARGDFAIQGFSNRALRPYLPRHTPAQVSRLLKRLHLHGLIKKVGRRYKYYLTKLGRDVVLSALKLRELVVIPLLAGIPLAPPESCAS
jgi:hypothetical protein